MKKLKKDQRGFSLIELVIVIGLTGIITAAITGAILGVFNTDARTRDDMTAVYQVRQAGKLVSQDILQAQSVNATGGSGFPLRLTWTDWATGYTHAVNYTLENMPGGLKRLQRSESVNGGAPTVNPLVAEYIDPSHTSCVPLGVLQAGATLTFTVTATVGGQSETRVYEVKPRPGS
jgi:prepilin-type N-terminal cleavage/methylation domain-containing protein